MRKTSFTPIIMGILMIAGIAAIVPAPTATAQPASVGRITLSPTEVEVGDFVEMAVDVEEVENLGAFQLTITWDPTHLAFYDGIPGNFIEVEGRDVTYLPPAGHLGRLTLAAYSIASGPRPGATGSGNLLTARFQARRAGASEVRLPELILTDTSNLPIPVADRLGATVGITMPPTIYLPTGFRAAPIGGTEAASVRSPALQRGR